MKPVSTTLNDNHRILAQGRYINNNTWQTGLNNNDLIIGVSGAGKTRGYVIPNILHSNESMVIVDTKNTLSRRLSPHLTLHRPVLSLQYTGHRNACRISLPYRM